MPIIHDCEQRSREWFNLRIGKPTASEFHRILTPKKMEISKQSESYMHELLSEMILGRPLDTTESEWMIRGQELEDSAIRAYEFQSEVETERVGFITDAGGVIGCSPDRLVGEKGLLEIKCPSPQVHVKYMIDRGVDEAYRVQLQGQLLVSDRDWVDILSYHPEMAPVVIRVTRDGAMLGPLAKAVYGFSAVLLETYAKLEKLYGPFVRPEPVSVDQHQGFGVTDADVDEILAWQRSNHV